MFEEKISYQARKLLYDVILITPHFVDIRFMFTYTFFPESTCMMQPRVQFTCAGNELEIRQEWNLKRQEQNRNNAE